MPQTCKIPVIFSEFQDVHISSKLCLDQVSSDIERIFDEGLQVKGLTRLSPIWFMYNNPQDSSSLVAYAQSQKIDKRL